ncbi:glycosyltransferase family 4 protein [Sphingobacterium bovistauri]|uniref:Glycosyltransferase family 4 protein n=1 Tax=Sphingobacterium bovistauri TaxID=2781959 RepID=A0ABS7Z1Q0_9SPHI|nr:glycosyltransferase family 4 protein [Sphingobacterium bovistauri]MCA5004099.1 glycosyltransferase family 4 protein [Sphingobacterium bovistauri]
MHKGKKILIHSIAFSPDGVSTAYLYNDIAKGFKEKGYEVVVLTTTPHYNVVESELKKQPLKKRALGLFYESNFEGIKILHVPQKKFKSTILRLFGFVYWHIMAIILGLNEKNVLALLSPSPPLTIGFINLLIGKIKGAKVVYNVQEIYPDFLIEQGGLKSKILIKILKWLERYVYNKSDAVTTIDEIFYKTIVSRFDDKIKLHIIPNFVDTDLYKPLDNSTINLDPHIFPQNNDIKLMYAGNIGHAQDWEPMVQLAIYLKNEPFEFYVIGEGVMKSYVEDKVKENGLKNVHILPYQPRETMPQLLDYADLQFIFMSKEMEGHGFPSKVYTIMACGKPLLVCSGEKSPIVNFLKPIDCAALITTSRFEVKINEMVSFLRRQSKKSLQEMGKKGLEEVDKFYSKDVVVNKYVDLIDNLLD